VGPRRADSRLSSFLFSHRFRIAGGAVALCAVLAFLPSLWATFVADDFIMLRTLDHLEGIEQAFTLNDRAEAGGAGHFYRPIWVLWNAALVGLFHGAPEALHAANVLLYALIAIEVWLLLRRFTGDFGASAGALFFAVYPRHAESVAWISGNTDLTATAIALGGLLVLLVRDPGTVHVLGAGVLAGAAALTKESTFVLPLLALLLLFMRSRLEPEAIRRVVWLGPVAMLLAQLAVLAVRSQVLGGVGGYGEYPWTPLRAGAVTLTYVLASTTPPQLELILYPAFLLVPVLVIGLAAWAFLRLVRTRERSRALVALVGAAWFFVSLLPVVNLAVDLNTANGERLLFLPSVGLALIVAALVPCSWGPRRAAVLGIFAILGLVSAAQSSYNWVVAGRMAERMVRQATDLGPPSGELVLLSSPDNYRTAHVLIGGLPAALERAGRRDLTVAWCAPVQVRSAHAGQISFRQLGDGSYEGTATWSAPFDFPVLRDPTPLTPDCAYARVGSDIWPVGLRLASRVSPTPARQPAVLAFFDGHDLRLCC